MSKIKKQLLLFLFSIFLLFSCSQQNNEVKSKTKTDTLLITQFSSALCIDSTAVEKTDSIVYHVKEKSKGLNLFFTTIAQSEFENYYTLYNPKIYYDSTKINKQGVPIYLTTANFTIKLFCPENFNNCTSYEGFLKPLKMYITNHLGEGYSNLALIDSATDITYIPPCDFDDGNALPLISKEEKQLLIYSTTVFNRESSIALYKINKST